MTGKQYPRYVIAQEYLKVTLRVTTNPKPIATD
jgi:hypothetical protein